MSSFKLKTISSLKEDALEVYNSNVKKYNDMIEQIESATTYYVNGSLKIGEDKVPVDIMDRRQVSAIERAEYEFMKENLGTIANEIYKKLMESVE